LLPRNPKNEDEHTSERHGDGDLPTGAVERASEPVGQPPLKRPTVSQECVSEHVRADREKAL